MKFSIDRFKIKAVTADEKKAAILFADELEGKKDLKKALHELIKREVKAHERIVFNGNGYDESWVQEAERRGLLNLKTTPDCIPYLIA